MMHSPFLPPSLPLQMRFIVANNVGPPHVLRVLSTGHDHLPPKHHFQRLAGEYSIVQSKLCQARESSLLCWQRPCIRWGCVHPVTHDTYMVACSPFLHGRMIKRSSKGAIDSFYPRTRTSYRVHVRGLHVSLLSAPSFFASATGRRYTQESRRGRPPSSKRSGQTAVSSQWRSNRFTWQTASG